MANFFNTPLFGLTLSVLAYTIGLLIYRRFPNPLTTPLLVSTALIIVILHLILLLAIYLGCILLLQQITKFNCRIYCR